MGLAVMLLSIGVARGFQQAVREKVAGFEGHIRVSKFDYNQSQNLLPITLSESNKEQIAGLEGVKSVNTFSLKGGIIKFEGVTQGAVLKGFDRNYSWNFFHQYIVSGRIPILEDSAGSKEVIISENLANTLHLDTGKSFLMYFVQDPPRIRKFTVCGIYNTGFEEFDKHYVLGDMRQIQKLNQWEVEQISGMEIHLESFDQSESMRKKLDKILDYDIKSEALSDRYPMIIDWLNLLDTNVYFIIGLMVLIAGITIIATLLILILEKTALIGTLKALGANTSSIRKIFLYRTFILIIKGMVVGNLIGLGIGLSQQHWEIIPLDPKNYYMDTVPFFMDISAVVLLNLGVIVVTMLMVLWPSSLIARISPAKSIKFK